MYVSKWTHMDLHTSTYMYIPLHEHAHTPTIYTCPMAESSNFSKECFSQSENGHKMNEYSDLIEFLRNSVLVEPLKSSSSCLI